MSSVIKLVKNDNLPSITLALTDINTGAAIDLSAATTSVSVKFRQQGTTVVLSTLTCTKTNGGIDGKITFSFPGAALAVPAGLYEGEIEISFNGLIQSVYDLLKFRVRDDV